MFTKVTRRRPSSSWRFSHCLGDALATVALIGCKLKPSTCFEVVRQSIEVTEEDRTLFTRFQVTGFGRETTCSGAFTNIWCEGDLIR